ncbi:class I SAM-dependent methyltransferase [Methanocella sp. MCL-LM]|uniref:class I SAM-dependent methyltransferase n=1 Tax=Methanocella sp. MCL-LM TaxID=3412035 RepID=UPI003C791C79
MDDVFNIKDSRVNKEELIIKIQQNLNARKTKGAYSKNDENLLNSLSLSSSSQQNDLDKLKEEITRLKLNAAVTASDYKIASHRMLVGPVLVKGRTLVNGEVKRYVDPMLSRQQSFNYDLIQYQENIVNYMEKSFDVLRSEMLARTRDISDDIQYALSSEVGDKILVIERELNDRLDKHLKNTVNNSAVIAELRTAIEADNKKAIEEVRAEILDNLVRTNARFEGRVADWRVDFRMDLNDRIIGLRSEFRQDTNDRIGALRNDLREEIVCHTLEKMRIALSALGKGADAATMASLFTSMPQQPAKLSSVSTDAISGDYLQFSREIGMAWTRISGQSSVSPSLMEDAIDLFKESHVIIDIGCGSGFFLEQLRNAGIRGYGVDLNEKLIELCISKGLDARCIDAVGHLASLDDEVLDGIFICQVLEHLTIDGIDHLLSLCYRKLKPGKALIASIPNIQNIIVSSNLYYMDPTHQTHLHPEVLKYILRKCKFSSVEERYYQQVPEEMKLRMIEPPGTEQTPEIKQAIESINHNVALLNQLLFSARDYAVICRK